MQKKKFRLPKAIYEGLPLFYLVSGVLVMFLLYSPLALVSGGVLVMMGLLIRQMRRNYRSPHQALHQNLRQPHG